jgi:plastocyanin
MSRNARFASIAGAVTVAALVCLVIALVMTQHASSSSGEVRIIHLVVRDMAYYVNGHDDANPTLRIRRGERVRIIVTSRDVGMKHDFGVDAWRARTRLINGIGEARIEFVAASAPGNAVYSCSPHGAMMHGTIRVE